MAEQHSDRVQQLLDQSAKTLFESGALVAMPPRTGPEPMFPLAEDDAPYRSETLFVPGSPEPQGSHRVYNGRVVESSKKVGPWRERVALAAHEHGFEMQTSATRVELVFVRPRPVSTPKSRTPPAIKKPDVDKLTRAILDALTGIAFDDDSRVTDIHARKRLAEIGETPGAFITVSADQEA